MSAVVAAAFLMAAAPASKPVHPCGADAAKHGRTLLNLHFSDGEPGIDEPILSIGKTVKVLPPLKALKGKGSFDVLEVWGFVYKAEYRMRFIYARIPGECVLMGQEILEASDPY